MEMIYLNFLNVDIEFEIKNIDTIPYANEREIIETLKGKGFLESHKNSKKSLFPSQDIGTFLLEIMNNCKSIKKIILCNYMKLSSRVKETGKSKDIILKDKFRDDYNSYITERKKLEEKLKNTCYTIFEKLLCKLEKLYPKLIIFHKCALDYMEESYISYQNELKDLKETFVKLEKSKNRGGKMMSFYLNYKEQLQEKDNIEYLLYRLSKAVADFVNDFLEGKQLIENAFIHSEETRNNKFSGIMATLPSTKIDYKLDGFKCATPYKYIYEIKNVQDLFNVTIYQLSLNRKVIIKCKNCGKYLIPLRTDQIFCTTDPLSNISCKNRYWTKRRKENASATYIYYRQLYNKYKNTKVYEKVFEELKSIYTEKYITKQVDDEEFMQILFDFENKVNSTYKVKRGRPKKNKNV